MEGGRISGWVLALAGSLVLHAAIIGLVAVPSIFSHGGGASEPPPQQQTEPAKPGPERPKEDALVQQPAAPATSGEVQRPDFHIVRQGDTITKIAKDYGMTPEEIARINGKPLKRLNNIWVGQKIKLK